MREKWPAKFWRTIIHGLAILVWFWEKIFSDRQKLKIDNCLPASATLKALQAGKLKILLIQSHHFGDLILTLPAIVLVRQKYPDAKITLLLGSWQKPLTPLIQGVDEIIYFDFPWTDRSEGKKKSFFDVLRLIEKLRKEKFDLAINFSPDFYVNLMIWRADIPERVGFANAGSRFLTQSWPDREDCHQSENLAKLVTPNFHTPKISNFEFPARRCYPPTSTKLWRVAGGRISNLRQLKRGQIALQLASGAPARNWPQEYSEKLIDILTKKGYKVKVIEQLGIPLEKLPKFLADCRVFIGPNSGPGHLAALVGTPVISIFSAANNPKKWQPKGKNVTILTKNVPCKNCGFHICPKNNYCLRLIKPEEVVKCLEKIYPL